MMLRHLGWPEAAALVVKGMDGAISAKHVTYDFARLMEGATEVATSGFADTIIDNMLDRFRPIAQLQDAMNRKVTVVGGAGNVGATVARAIADKELADVVIIDIADQKAAGIALDMLEACPIEGSDSRVVGYGANEEGWAQTADSDVVVITSGVPRKPGMSRDDLLNVNYKIMQSVTEQIVKHSPNTIIVPVANPLDAMCQAVYRLSGFPRERVIGMAGMLDSARMRAFIAMETGVSVENIHAFVLGGHGDTMVPLARYSTIAGIPLAGLSRADRGKDQGDQRADGQRRRGDHQAGGHERLVRARICRGRDGRDHPQGQEEDRALLGVPAGGVPASTTSSSACRSSWRARRRADHPDQADGRRGRGAEKSAGGGEGIDRRHRRLNPCSAECRVRTQSRLRHWASPPCSQIYTVTRFLSAVALRIIVPARIFP